MYVELKTNKIDVIHNRNKLSLLAQCTFKLNGKRNKTQKYKYS